MEAMCHLFGPGLKVFQGTGQCTDLQRYVRGPVFKIYFCNNFVCNILSLVLFLVPQFLPLHNKRLELGQCSNTAVELWVFYKGTRGLGAGWAAVRMLRSWVSWPSYSTFIKASLCYLLDRLGFLKILYYHLISAAKEKKGQNPMNFISISQCCGTCPMRGIQAGFM